MPVHGSPQGCQNLPYRGTPAALKASIPGRQADTVTLDDVFVHYTGHDLRDALQAPSAMDSPFVMRR